MTATTRILTAIALTCTLFGCASAPTADAVEVVTAELGEERFELVEMSSDGFIDVEVYYSAGQAEEVVNGVFRWRDTDPTPIELTELLASIPERVIENATPISSTLEVSVHVVWPRLLTEARLYQQWNLGFDCDETMGHSDCLQTR